jgi:hypothetical protein
VTSRAGSRRASAGENKKKAKKAGKREKADRSPGSFDRVFPIAFRVLLFAALTLGTVYGFRRIRERALDLEEFRVRPDSLAIVKKPAWLANDVVSEIRRDLAAAPALSLFDPALPAALRGAVGENPWVEEVRRVNRRFPDKVVVHAKLRRPVAAIATRGRGGPFALVDENGRVLRTGVTDLTPWRESARSPLFEVRGVRTAEIRTGAVLSDPALREAAALAKDLESLSPFPAFRDVAIVAMDVSGVDSSGTSLDAGIALETASGVVIEWGHSSRSRVFGEPTLEEKIAGLERVLAAYPRLGGLRTVNLRMPDPFVALKRRPDIPEE